jgi:dihydropteroate synthase
VDLLPVPDLQGFPGLGRTRVMGVVNVTPDSFSDGGLHAGTAGAVRHGLRLLDQGADLLDVGGESTRPGAERVSEDEERARVLPVVAALASAGAVVSVDTMRAQVAVAALDAGAQLVNDVSGGLADPAMLEQVAERGCAYVAMHWRGHSTTMQARAVYGDVVGEVTAELAARQQAARGAGVAPGRLLLDPGLGFAKEAGPQLDPGRAPSRGWPGSARCWSGPRARASWVRCSPRRRASRARPASATRRPPR